MKAFDALGSFRAEYDFTTPEKTGKVRIAHHAGRGYTLFKLDMIKPVPGKMFSLMLIENAGKPSEVLHLYVAIEEQNFHMKLSMEDMFRNPSQPLGALMLIFEQYIGLWNKSDFSFKAGRLRPDFQLDIVGDKLNLGIGTLSSGTSPETSPETSWGVSWLAPEIFERALSVEETDGNVVLEDEDGKRTVILRKNGLLSRIHWPGEDERQRPVLQLIETAPLEEDQPFQSLLPEFEKVVFREMPPSQLLGPATLSVFRQLHQELKDLESGEPFLDGNADAVAAAILKGARARIRPLAREIIATNKTSDPIANALRQRHTRFLEKHPELKGKLSFGDFLDLHFANAEQKPESTSLPPVDELAKRIQQNLESAKPLLPPEKDALLRRLYETGLTPLMNAWRLEILSATLEHAKSAKAP